MTNEWTVTHGKHEIRVVRTSSSGAHLYVDGESLDTTNDLYASGDEPALVGTFGEHDIVEVFMKSATEAAIYVNGKSIPRAYAVAS